MPGRKPFQIQWASRHGEWINDIAVLFSRAPINSGLVWPPWTGKNKGPLKPVLGVVLSVLAHATAFLLITHLNFLSGYVPPHIAQEPAPTPIYLDLEALKALHILRSLPVIQPAGPGGVAGRSEQTVHVVLQAATVEHPKVTIVLNPLKPDNARQAVHQQMAPPDLKIQVEQKVPDILMAENPTIARPSVDMTMHQPNGPARSNDHPVDAPTVAANAPELALTITSSVAQPQLPVSYFASGSMQAPRGSKTGGGAKSASGGSEASGGSSSSSGDAGSGVVVMSVDPGTFAQLAS